LNALFIVSQTEWDTNSIPLSLYAAPVIIIAGFIVHIIRFKTKFYKGAYTSSLIVLLGSLFISIFATPIFDSTYMFLILVGVLYILIYFFFYSTFKGDYIVYLLKIFTSLGILVSIQILLFYVMSEDLEYVLQYKILDLGWGISNFIATYLIMFIFSTGNFITNNKYRMVWIFVMVFEILMLFLTLSRGGVLAFISVSILLVILMLFKSRIKLSVIMGFSISTLVITIFIGMYPDLFVNLWNRLTLYGMDDTGRFEIWQTAFDQFLAHPLFGVGLYSRLINDTYLGLNHNTILQTAASFGLVGLIALGLMFYETIKVFFKNINHEKMILFIALVGANIHGMVDNVFYMPQFMIIFFIIIAVVENANKAEEEAKEIVL
jgi:O-antigen ligase